MPPPGEPAYITALIGESAAPITVRVASLPMDLSDPAALDSLPDPWPAWATSADIVIMECESRRPASRSRAVQLCGWFRRFTEAALILINRGPALAFPYSSGIRQSRHNHMRELRVQHQGKPYRVLYAIDPRRTAILLIGGKKGGGKQWYKRFVPMADALYDEHLETLRREGRS